MEPIEALRKSGHIASKVRKRAHDYVRAGTKVIDVCESVERWIRELGGEPAFPCNVDLDRVAAHYTSPIGDATVISDGSLVKVDIGVHIDGYLADTATTICLNPQLERLVEAAEAALDSGIRAVRADTKASEVGSVIERTMRLRGVSPIRNLTGHRVARYVVHAGDVIPNVHSINGNRLKEGDVYAVEPFTTLPDAAGEVRDGPHGSIYLFQKKRSVSGEAAKEMLKLIQSDYRSLPFAFG